MDSIFRTLIAQLEDNSERIRECLAEGGAQDQENYWRLVGKYDALKFLRSHVDDERKKHADELTADD